MRYQESILFDPYWAPILGKTHAKEDALRMNALMVYTSEISHPFNLINSLFPSLMTMAVRNFAAYLLYTPLLTLSKHNFNKENGCDNSDNKQLYSPR